MLTILFNLVFFLINLFTWAVILAVVYSLLGSFGVLDTRNRVLAIKTVYVGNLNSAVVRVGELFRDAVRYNCAAIIVAHNHPSTDPTPSPEDVLVTRQIVEAGQLFDIEVLDHLVIGQGRFVSMRERGLGFSR